MGDPESGADATGDARGQARSFDELFGAQTAVSAHLHQHGQPQGEQALSDLSASFQAAVIEQFVRKTALALDLQSCRRWCCRAAWRAIGHCGHPSLRSVKSAVFRFRRAAQACGDNAAMIAAAGYYRLWRGERADLNKCRCQPSL